jgi:hypothetical protein
MFTHCRIKFYSVLREHQKNTGGTGLEMKAFNHGIKGFLILCKDKHAVITGVNGISTG